MSAGEATIFADAAGSRGVLRIRVYPSFGGIWGGTDALTSCQASGDFAGFCDGFVPGETLQHGSSFTQADATVNASIDGGDGTFARMTGTISVGGDLELPSAPFLPADPEVAILVQNWRSRSDAPGVMTGSYEVLATVPGAAGELRLGVRLQNVFRLGGQTTQTPSTTGPTIGSKLRRWQR